LSWPQGIAQDVVKGFWIPIETAPDKSLDRACTNTASESNDWSEFFSFLFYGAVLVHLRCYAKEDLEMRINDKVVATFFSLLC
jgi:hypothetical protein